MEQVEGAAREREAAAQQAEAARVEALQGKAEAEARLKTATADIATLQKACDRLQSELNAGVAAAAAEAAQQVGSGAADTASTSPAASKAADAQTAAQKARLADLEKQNKELAWQIAMLTRGAPAVPVATGGGRGPPGSVSVPMPLLSEEAGQTGTLPGVIGLVLRYRKHLVASYLLVLHALVYLAATRSAAVCSGAGAADAAAAVR